MPGKKGGDRLRFSRCPSDRYYDVRFAGIMRDDLVVRSLQRIGMTLRPEKIVCPE